MNKYTSILWLASFSLSNLFVSSASKAATPGIDMLKENAIKSFLQKANNPKTPLHRKLVELNQADGRNSNGIFPKTLTAKNIQIVTIDGQDQFGFYCSIIEGNPKHSECSNGVSETYLIMIPSKMYVHKAVVYNRFLFIVKASKSVKWKLNEKEKEYDRKELIQIDEPIQIETQKFVSNGSSQ